MVELKHEINCHEKHPHGIESIKQFWIVPGNRFGIVVISIFIILSFLPIQWLPSDPTMVDLSIAKQPGFWAGENRHPLGTDFLGRDVLARIIRGTQLTILISSTSIILATIFGSVIGLLSGYLGGYIDLAISWLIDIQQSFPVIALAVLVIAIIGGSIPTLILVLALTCWSGIARLVRGQTLYIQNEAYIDAAIVIGASPTRILFKHILPNLISPLSALVTFEIARLILAESALSFLGLGVAAPDITWGGLIGDGRQYIFDSWWIATFPGIAIALLVISFNFIGDGIRDFLDPATRRVVS